MSFCFQGHGGRPPLDLSRFVSATFPLEDGVRAFEEAGRKGVLKVQLIMSTDFGSPEAESRSIQKNDATLCPL